MSITPANVSHIGLKSDASQYTHWIYCYCTTNPTAYIIQSQELPCSWLSVGQSVSQSIRPSVLTLSPSGTHGQILAVVKAKPVLSWGVLLDERAGLNIVYF